MKKKFGFAYIHIFLIVSLFPAMVLVSVSTAYAATYYVTQNGNDSNPGTINNPWRTIAKANRTLGAGDSVYIRQGTYNERIAPTNSGRNGESIVYQNYQDEKVTITGSWGKGAELVGCDYIAIVGLTFDGQNNVPVGIFINSHGDNITIKDCVVRNYRDADNTWGHGIWTGLGGVSYLLIEDCEIYHNGTTNPYIENGNNISIFGGADHITIRGCDIYESNTEDGIHLVPTTGRATDILIENCRFWGNKEDGIDIKQVERVTVRNCEFWNHRSTPTGGGTGIQIHQGANNVIVDNCISHDNEKNGVRIEYNCSWLTCPATQNITVQRSIFYGNAEGITVVGGQWNAAKPGMLKNIHLNNNVLYNNDSGIFLFAHPGGEITSLASRNNVFMNNNEYDYEIHSKDRIDYQSDYNNYVDSVTSETHSLSLDPIFRDPENHDFHLTRISPLIDKGIDIGLLFKGSSPDIGAYEYDANSPLQPPSNLRILHPLPD